MNGVLIAVLTSTGNVLLDKFILAKRKMAIGHYIPLLFAFLFLVTLVTLPWLGAINPILAGNQQYIFYFILMVLLAIIWNIFYYQGLQHESMIEFEMIVMLAPLAIILLASLFYPEEFNGTIFGAALIGALALIFSRIKKHHFRFDTYAIHLVLAVFLIAMEAMVQKELLSIYSPALLYALRTAVIALFFGMYYRPKIHEIQSRDYKLVFTTALLGAAAMILTFYGYQALGVTYTTLILLLVPVLTSFVDAWINNTSISRRTVLAFFVILACVVYVVIQ